MKTKSVHNDNEIKKFGLYCGNNNEFVNFDEFCEGFCKTEL